MLRTLAAVLMAFGIAAGAEAQTSKPPLHILVGFAPGGSVDVLARLVADPLSRSLGRPVLVENRTGAGGQIAAVALKNAAPDGNTVMVCPDHVPVIVPLTIKEPGFEAARDFTALGRAVIYQNGMAVSPSTEAKTPEEFAAWLKRNPAKASYGIPAAGSVPQFAGYLVAKRAGVDMAAVPYRGAAPVVQDLVAGQIPAGVGAIADMVPFHKDGKIRIIAVTGSQRSPIVPDVPTFQESGYPGLEADFWYGFFAPKGTPDAFVKEFSAALKEALAVPAVRERLSGLTMTPSFSTPEELAEAVKTGSAHWRPIIEASGYQKQ